MFTQESVDRKRRISFHNSAMPFLVACLIIKWTYLYTCCARVAK